jgi:hypothetical protein
MRDQIQRLQQRVARLERQAKDNLPQTHKSAHLNRMAGSGLKAVHAIFPETMGSDKLAQKILMILSNAILDGDYSDVKPTTLNDDGSAFYYRTHYSSSYYDPDEDEDVEVEGATTGAGFRGWVELDEREVSEIAKLLRVKHLTPDFTDSHANEELSAALNKFFDRREKDVKFNLEQMDYMEYVDVHGMEIKEITQDFHYFGVNGFRLSGKKIMAHVSYSVVAEIEVEPPQEPDFDPDF